MKSFLSFLVALTLANSVLPLQAQKLLKPAITIQLPDGDGANSCSVIWNPITKKYYTTILGNAIYSMGVYDAKGKPVQENVEAEYDYRGFWYNPTTKRIEFNCYDTVGIGHLELDAKGKIQEKKIDIEGMNQPDNQAIGVYHTAANCLLYFSSNYNVEKYNPKTGKFIGTLTKIKVGCKNQSEVDELDEDTEAERWESRNPSSVQYTGIPKAELAILNYDDRIVELYDQKTGLMSSKFFKIPDSVTIHLNFNFCYNNNFWWFFNKDERKWVGCK